MKLVDSFLLSLPGRELKHGQIRIKKVSNSCGAICDHNGMIFQRFCIIQCSYRAWFSLALGAAVSAHY